MKRASLKPTAPGCSASPDQRPEATGRSRSPNSAGVRERRSSRESRPAITSWISQAAPWWMPWCSTISTPQPCLRAELRAIVSPNPFDLEPVKPVMAFDLARYRFADQHLPQILPAPCDSQSQPRDPGATAARSRAPRARNRGQHRAEPDIHRSHRQPPDQDFHPFSLVRPLPTGALCKQGVVGSIPISSTRLTKSEAISRANRSSRCARHARVVFGQSLVGLVKSPLVSPAALARSQSCIALWRAHSEVRPEGFKEPTPSDAGPRRAAGSVGWSPRS